MISRRHLMTGAASVAALVAAPGGRGAGRPAGTAPFLAPALPQGAKDNVTLEALPGKAPLLKLSYRPPNYETPLSYFDEPITPNEAFFVRYHYSGVPDKIDAEAWLLAIGGDGVAKPFQLSLPELQALPAVEILAVLQCAGNRRGLVEPHTPGLQWGYGGMGAARWTGVRLRDILDRAGLKKETIEIAFDGADFPLFEKIPKFAKSIPIAKALDENVILAYAMNGRSLPHFNGYPVRAIVPGWAGTYWLKHLTSVTAVTKPLANFWMAKAYRLPSGKFAYAQHFVSQENDKSSPIAELLVNSLLTAPENGGKFRLGQTIEARGLAWDAGYGLDAVEVSTDGGKSFSLARLEEDQGRFAFREFFFSFTPSSLGPVAIVANARNRIGQTQTAELIPNPGGYHHNLMARVVVEVV